MAVIGKGVEKNIVPWVYETVREHAPETDPVPIADEIQDKIGEDLERGEAWEKAKELLADMVPGIRGVYLKSGKPPEDVIQEEVQRFQAEHQDEYLERMAELQEAEAEREQREEVESKLRGAEQRINELERQLERREELSERKVDSLEEELEFLQQMSNRLLEDVPKEKVERLKNEFLKMEDASESEFWDWFEENNELVKEKSGVLPSSIRKNYMEPWMGEEEAEEEVEEETGEVEEAQDGLSNEAVRELTQDVVQGSTEAPEEVPKISDTGAPLERLEDYLGIDLPPGMVYYICTDPKSKHYKQIFNLTKKGNLGRTTSLNNVLKKIRKLKGEVEKTVGQRVEVGEKPKGRGLVTEEKEARKPERRRKKPEEHELFDDFLKEEFDMTYSDYQALEPFDKRSFRQAFRTWLRGH